MKYVAKRQAELKELYLWNKAKWEEDERKEEQAVKERRSKHHCTGCPWARWETDKKVYCSRFPCVKSY